MPESKSAATKKAKKVGGNQKINKENTERGNHAKAGQDWDFKREVCMTDPKGLKNNQESRDENTCHNRSRDIGLIVFNLLIGLL
jgi:hypothetical protein